MIESFDLDKIDNILKELNGHYESKPVLNKQNEEIEKLTIQLANNINKIQRKQWIEKVCFRLGIILLLVGIIILFWSKLEIHFIYFIRLCIVYLVPFIDLTNISSSCLIHNPSYEVRSRFTRQICEGACNNDNVNKNMYKFTDIDFNETIFRNYVIGLDLPLVESGEISNWKIKDSAAIIDAFVTKINDLESKHFCDFKTTKSLKIKSPLNFIKKFSIERPSSYFAKWENCHYKTFKLVKKLIRRPKFLSPSIELIGNNMIFLSKGYNQKEFFPLESFGQTKLICQIKGSTEIILTPVEECRNECDEQIIYLEEGQIAIITDMWNVDFKVAPEVENLVLILNIR